MAAASNVLSTTRVHPFPSSEELEDSISRELMTRAVTIVPCGHVFNEDTVIQLLASSKLCPIDRKPIDQHVPNYNIRALAERVLQGLNQPQEEIISEEAQRHFLRGKELADQGDKEKAIPAFLKALQLSPTYEKAQSYLEFCLGISSRNTPAAPAQSPKDQYSDLLLRLVENPLVQQNTNLAAILESQLDELMSSSSTTLSQTTQTIYQWIQKLLVDGKVSQFVAKKLLQIHSQAPAVQTVIASPLPTVSPALEKELREFINKNAFGSVQWMSFFGGVGVEPLPPLDIEQRLDLPCPFWPGKKIKDTHRLIFIPETVCGEPLTLKFLGDLIQKPRQGNPGQYSHFDLGDYQDSPTSSGHWALVTLEPIPETEGKSYAEQQEVLTKYCKNFGMRYEVSHVLDTVVTLCMENLKNSTKFTYSRCQESYDISQQVCVATLIKTDVAIKEEKSNIPAPIPPVFPLLLQARVFSPFPLYVNPPAPPAYEQALHTLTALDRRYFEIEARYHDLRHEMNDCREKRETAEKDPAIVNYLENCHKSKLTYELRKKEYYSTQINTFCPAFSTALEPFIFSPFPPYTPPVVRISDQKLEEKKRELELELEEIRLKAHNDSLSYKDPAHAYEYYYQKKASLRHFESSNHRGIARYLQTLQKSGSDYAQSKKEYEDQCKVLQAAYEKKKKEHDASCLAMQQEYDARKKEYEEDQKAFAGIGIRAQHIF